MTSDQSITRDKKIVGVARELFTTRGYANVTMRGICRAANVTAPTVYYYFKNKRALFDTVVRETIIMNEFIGRLDEASKKARTSERKIAAFARTYLSLFPNDRLNVGLYIRDSTDLDPVGRRTLASEFSRIQAILTEIIREGIDTGEFRSTQPKMAAECLLGMMHRFVFQRIHFRRDYSPAAASSYLADFFLRAMKPSKYAKTR